MTCAGESEDGYVPSARRPSFTGFWIVGAADTPAAGVVLGNAEALQWRSLPRAKLSLRASSDTRFPQ
jgi:hypothetical protein